MVLCVCLNVFFPFCFESLFCLVVFWLSKANGMMFILMILLMSSSYTSFCCVILMNDILMFYLFDWFSSVLILSCLSSCLQGLFNFNNSFTWRFEASVANLE